VTPPGALAGQVGPAPGRGSASLGQAVEEVRTTLRLVIAPRRRVAKVGAAATARIATHVEIGIAAPASVASGVPTSIPTRVTAGVATRITAGVNGGLGPASGGIAGPPSDEPGGRAAVGTAILIALGPASPPDQATR
jgi:hypothetical protein